MKKWQLSIRKLAFCYHKTWRKILFLNEEKWKKWNPNQSKIYFISNKYLKKNGKYNKPDRNSHKQFIRNTWSFSDVAD
jgi:hypothetical protein